MITIDLKGQCKEFEAGVTPADVAKSIGMGLYKSACAAKVDGEVCDLRTPLEKDCALEILTFDTAEGKHAYWHTTSHIMAQAVMRLYPGTKFSIGPAIENGFYYDFDMEKPLSTEDLPAIEAEMKKIIKENLPLERFELPPEEAQKLMADQPYKEELIAEHAGKGENISFYKQGDFTDLCAGPHLLSTGSVKAVKLTAITGAYWRGDAKNKMLTRVYGISFPKQSLLDEHLQMLEEAKKRDHRKLGKELNLFMLRDEGPGFPFFLPKAMVLKNLLIDYWREVHKKYGYVEVSTPVILSRKLWERSGHWDHYKDNMYTTVIDEEDFAIKPMNCPGGMMVYKSQPHSYRDLPLRVGELGLVHRHELSGALHGLFRVRCFTQDDANLFMTPDQLKDELDAYLQRIEEAKKRDHRRLGKELGLFMLRDEGPGFPFFLPKGMVLKNTLLDYWRQIHKKYGYVEISTPIILNRQLWERSGHWDHYKQNMYTTVIDGEDYAIKPMNCPGGMLVYASEPHSYPDLPLRVGEIGLVHRHELSGALHGLFRVRCFSQDDAHIFMTQDQLKDVIQETVRLFDEVYSTFGLSYTIELSTMPEDHIGTVEQWEHNQDILKDAITDMGKDFVINEGDGAFYGPKLDFHLADSLGRTWQCGTIQLDSQLPERFELEYTGEDGQKHRPVMIHRVVLGSIERFIGVITEHFAGAFPAWLAPVQVKILPVTDRAAQYADQIAQKLDGDGYRVEVDHRSEKIGKKIREAQLEKVPYMLVVGDRDMENETVSLRLRSGEDQGAMSLADFEAIIAEDVRTKVIR